MTAHPRQPDLVLGPGEVAQFDTQVRHWFGTPGDGPAEVLGLYGRHDEYRHTHGVGHMIADELAQRAADTVSRDSTRPRGTRL